MSNFQVKSRQWWVERWLELLDSYRFKKRLERGRNYAREGNVLSIEFFGNQVSAKVQGSETEPYRVALALEPFNDENRERALKMMSQPPLSNEDWDCVINTLSEKAIFSASLLAGEMPEDIEQVFTGNGLSLFPFSLNDVRSRCSCPDKANPCKHIAAVYYQLADRFSEDPFIIFQLRGRSKQQILDSLREKRQQQTSTLPTETITFNKLEDSAPKTQTTNLDLQQFWQYDEPLESSLVAIAPSLDNKNILNLLGTIPLPAADAEAVEQYLTLVYQTASQNAISAALDRG
jgi:uncharacterized Zn finger protein